MYKLIRDKLPEQLDKAGQHCDYAVAINDELYAELLMAKLIEAVNDYLGNFKPENLVELVTVVNALLPIHEMEQYEFDALYQKTLKNEGGYERRFIGFFPNDQTSLSDAKKTIIDTLNNNLKASEEEVEVAEASSEDTSDEDDFKKHLA